VATEDELLAGVAAGDPDWEGIFRAYAKDVRAAAQQVLGAEGRIVDSKDVDDVVQQTFEEAMKGGVLTPNTRSIPAKLRVVARRRAMDAVRRGSKIHDARIEDMPNPEQPAEDDIETFVEDDFEMAIRQAIWRNQRRLTPRERIIFRAKTEEGLTFDEIGKRLNLTPQRVGQIYRGAIRKLTAGLDLTGDGGDIS
jgi:RNA polymerase sigma factor (sigma-70 family)